MHVNDDNECVYRFQVDWSLPYRADYRSPFTSHPSPCTAGRNQMGPTKGDFSFLGEKANQKGEIEKKIPNGDFA